MICEDRYRKIIDFLIEVEASEDPYADAVELLYPVIPYDEVAFIRIGEDKKYRGAVTACRPYTEPNERLETLLHSAAFITNDPTFDFGNKSSGRAIRKPAIYFTDPDDAYGSGLRRCGIETFLAFSTEPSGEGIRLYRRGTAGPFTEEDLEVSRIVAEALRIIMNGFFDKRALSKNQNIESILYEKITFGIMIFDEQLELLRYNHLAVQRLEKITGEREFSKMLAGFREILKQKIRSMERNHDMVLQEIVDGDYILEITIYKDLNDQNTLETYYTVSLYSARWFRNFLLMSFDGTLEKFHLTPRERDIVNLVVRGKNSKEIAADMNISLNTERDHLKNIFRKMGVRNRSELIIKVFSQEIA